MEHNNSIILWIRLDHQFGINNRICFNTSCFKSFPHLPATTNQPNNNKTRQIYSIDSRPQIPTSTLLLIKRSFIDEPKGTARGGQSDPPAKQLFLVAVAAAALTNNILPENNGKCPQKQSRSIVLSSGGITMTKAALNSSLLQHYTQVSECSCDSARPALQMHIFPSAITVNARSRAEEQLN